MLTYSDHFHFELLCFEWPLWMYKDLQVFIAVRRHSHDKKWTEIWTKLSITRTEADDGLKKYAEVVLKNLSGHILTVRFFLNALIFKMEENYWQKRSSHVINTMSMFRFNSKFKWNLLGTTWHVNKTWKHQIECLKTGRFSELKIFWKNTSTVPATLNASNVNPLTSSAFENVKKIVELPPDTLPNRPWSIG